MKKIKKSKSTKRALIARLLGVGLYGTLLVGTTAA